MRKVPCSSAEAKGLKFSTSVGLPASPWMVSVPPPEAELLLALDEQAAAATTASAVVAAQRTVLRESGLCLMAGSPHGSALGTGGSGPRPAWVAGSRSGPVRPRARPAAIPRTTGPVRATAPTTPRPAIRRPWGSAPPHSSALHRYVR